MICLSMLHRTGSQIQVSTGVSITLAKGERATNQINVDPPPFPRVLTIP